ncbi:MAG: hypothetical protein A2046_10210 [Bacteroidetes bacterium GWA2_30_7]|nr:MAG: hypothetical protein A2046_10210 [Bacteroidetes bacterium GWA2_30_7]
MLNEKQYFPELLNCKICPRNCSSNRYSGKLGFCKSGSDSGVVSVCIHKGEEPVISGQKGICNVFFGHCNMQCVYCQNFQISNNNNNLIFLSFANVIEKIIEIIKSGVNSVGFVSPSHFIPQMKYIINELGNKGFKPIFIYNSNAYDSVVQLKSLENYIDIYLPDFKYFDNKLAEKYSDTKNYFELATLAIKEMYRQKGSSLVINDEGVAESGLIIRHLVLPDNTENSIKLLEFIAENISRKVSISLMSQYFPCNKSSYYFEINRKLLKQEYEKVINTLEKLEFNKGWIQNLNSSENYLPNFIEANPFKKKKLSF